MKEEDGENEMGEEKREKLSKLEVDNCMIGSQTSQLGKSANRTTLGCVDATTCTLISKPPESRN
jgi:hypothetical protein